MKFPQFKYKGENKNSGVVSQAITFHLDRQSNKSRGAESSIALAGTKPSVTVGVPTPPALIEFKFLFKINFHH